MTDSEALVVSEAHPWGPMYFNIYETAESAWGDQGEAPDWNAFVEMLRETSQDPIVGPDKKACKDAATAFCPTGSFANDGRRRKINAQQSWFIGIDAEEGPAEDLVRTLEVLSGHSTGVALESVLYTSAGHSVPAPRFRIFVPLAEPVQGWEPYQRTWKGIVAALGIVVDTGKRNPSDLFYQPAQYSSAEENLFLIIRGEKLTAAEWTSLAPPEPEPASPIEITLTRRVKDIGRFVRQGAVDRYTSTPKKAGSKSHFRLMCSIASTALEAGYSITPEEIVSLFGNIDRQSGGHYASEPATRMRHEASNALKWAATRIIPK